jgi:hypothetical protein
MLHLVGSGFGCRLHWVVSSLTSANHRSMQDVRGSLAADSHGARCPHAHGDIAVCTVGQGVCL